MRDWDTGIVVRLTGKLLQSDILKYFLLKTNQSLEIDMDRSKVGSSGTPGLDYNDFWSSPGFMQYFYLSTPTPSLCDGWLVEMMDVGSSLPSLPLFVIGGNDCLVWQSSRLGGREGTSQDMART